jgi:hypothetical protein
MKRRDADRSPVTIQPLLSIHPNAGYEYRAKGLNTKTDKINTRQEI